ncbi:hypothetical protein Tsubulata_013236 [Turnera subulata]|uniref:NB-ARC domain-containing protein n=1 Tax=Turnera subulata TaxID=218843 RepID=A0A9Q0FDU9_9ROSI|nr:hypothetical protein Tsubulata_013236 [Turnera subulata]
MVPTLTTQSTSSLSLLTDGKAHDRSLSEQILQQLRPSTCLTTLQWEVLTELKIECFDSIVRIGPEFYGIDSSYKKSFPSLEKLTFSNMPRLQQLMPPPPPVLDDDGQGRPFPLLQILHTEHCPVLESVVPILPELYQIKIISRGRLTLQHRNTCDLRV